MQTIRQSPRYGHQMSRTESCSKSHQAIAGLRDRFFTTMYIPYTSQNIKWSSRSTWNALAISQHFLDPFQISYCVKNTGTIIRKGWIPYNISGTTLPVQELWYQVLPWSQTPSPQLPISKTPIPRVISNFYSELFKSSPKAGGWGLMGCLGIFKAQINCSCEGKKGDTGTGN